MSAQELVRAFISASLRQYMNIIHSPLTIPARAAYVQAAACQCLTRHYLVFWSHPGSCLA
eukprot:6214508-Pleurochrysis_carterae.AAC.6